MNEQERAEFNNEVRKEQIRMAREERTCWHTYPPANSDGTCPSCGKVRTDAPQ